MHICSLQHMLLPMAASTRFRTLPAQNENEDEVHSPMCTSCKLATTTTTTTTRTTQLKQICKQKRDALKASLYLKRHTNMLHILLKTHSCFHFALPTFQLEKVTCLQCLRISPNCAHTHASLHAPTTIHVCHIRKENQKKTTVTVLVSSHKHTLLG